MPRDIPSLFRELLDRDFSVFVGKVLATVDPGAEFTPNWHIDLLAEYLEAIRRGELSRLIINMPPRSLKSVCVSVAWPAWILGHQPEKRILAASYSSSLAFKHSMDCRAVMQAQWYRCLFPKTKLLREQNQKQKFMTTKRGYRFATSVGGTLTGEGGGVLIVDDPLNAAHAMNARARAHVNQWFDQSLMTRLDDKRRGAVVVVMQRLHADDLCGHLFAKGGWEHVSLAAMEAERKIYDFGRKRYVREAGDVLHAGRDDAATLERTKNELGSFAYAAQYMQQPRPADGAMVRPWWLGRYDALPEGRGRVVQSWDTAIKAGLDNDASVCLTFVEWEGKSFLAEMVKERVEYPELRRLVISQALRWSPDAILMEDKASGQQLLQDMKRETVLPVIAARPRLDKVSRFAAVTPMIESGRLMLPKDALWLAEFEAELLSFPGSAHDDAVDALSQYFDWLRLRKGENLRIRSI